MGFILSGGLRDNFANLSPAHKQRKKKEPKKDEKTNEELALERRQARMLDEEIEESEEKFAALARGKLGRQSLLSGAPRNVGEAASGKRSAGSRGGAGSLLSGSRGVGGRSNLRTSPNHSPLTGIK